MTNTLAVEAVALTKSYGSSRVLNGVDLAVPPGRVLALLGPNGAGKTTAVRILSTLTRPDGGSARVCGYDVITQRHDVRRRISLTGQFVALDELQTGAENLTMVGQLRGLPARVARSRARQLLEQFDLLAAGERRVSTYSGGMRRRLDLAIGFVGRPEVLFLDEPTTGLDPRSRQAVWAVVEELTAEGVAVFLTTQYLDEADHLADRITVIDGGEVVGQGTPDELKGQAAVTRLDIGVADSASFEEMVSVFGRRLLHIDRSRLTVEMATDGDAAGVRALLDEIDPGRSRIARFRLRPPTLDDVFLSLTGHSPKAPLADAESETACQL